MANENDIVLIHYEDKPLVFARIESIEPDIKRGWYHVKLLMLQVPVQIVTWLLRDVYINGTEFTMGGNRMRMERVEAPPEEKTEREDPGSAEDAKSTPAKVISLETIKRK